LVHLEDSIRGPKRIKNLTINYSKDFGDNWTSKFIEDVYMDNNVTAIIIANENSIYRIFNPAIHKLDVTKSEQKEIGIFWPYISDKSAIIYSKIQLKFVHLHDSIVLVSGIERYYTSEERQNNYQGIFLSYSLYSENDGKTWTGFPEYFRRNLDFDHPKMPRLLWGYEDNTSNALEDPCGRTNHLFPMYYANANDSIGSVIIYADKPFKARPTQPFDPDFIKKLINQKDLSTAHSMNINYLTFGDRNTAYLLYYDSILKVFDRYKGQITIPIPYSSTSASVVYADSGVVYIEVYSGQANSRKYELYMLKTSDIVGIKEDDDTKQAALVIIYPNPAENILRWNIDYGTAEITDMQGRSMQVLPASARQADVSGLAAGVYVLTVRTAAGVVSRTFVKE
jgi:hypothetical protein